MDILDEFLGLIFTQHCPCFMDQCKIKDTSTQIGIIIDNIASRHASFNKIQRNNCNVIYNSEIVVSGVPEEASNKVQQYVSFMIRLGLLKPPKEQSNSSNASPSLSRRNFGSNIELDSNKSLFKQGSSELDLRLILTMNKDKSISKLWNRKYVDWSYLMKEIVIEDLPTEFINKFRGMSDTELIELCRTIFWFFRKGIVDNLIISLMPNETGCLALSAGSINLSSDYDVTVYGQCAQMLALIFNREIKDLFGKSSDLVFDTNVYSSSFISMVKPNVHPEWYMEGICGTYKFWYIKESEKMASDQHIWAVLKLYKALVTLKKEDPDVEDFLNELMERDSIIIDIDHVYIMLNTINESGHGIGFKASMKPGGLTYTEMTNHLSVINFKGSETYFTRGAFLDVVVNQQICKNKDIPISFDAYFDSYIENLADFCMHHGKAKYRKRIEESGKIMDYIKQREGLSVPIFTTQDFITLLDEHDYVEILRYGWDLCEEMLSDETTSDPKSMERVKAYAMYLAPRRTSNSFEDLGAIDKFEYL